MNPKTKIQKVTQVKLCSAKRPHIEQPPSVRFHPAWYQTRLGGGPAHGQTPYAISQLKGEVSQSKGHTAPYGRNFLV